MSGVQLSPMEEIIVDNFAGGGGASTGMELATGRIVKIAINHDPDAILMHKTNHPHTKHLQASVWDVDPVKECEGCPVGLAWFSPDCKHFSKAKGAALVDRNIRGLAWIVLRWAGTVRPRVIILENVEEFQTWGPVRRGKPVKKKAGQTFQRWKKQLSDLGYTIEHRELVAADYGAPTTRKRFFLVARCDGRSIVWPERTHDKDGADGLPKWRAAAEVIDWTQPCYSIFATKEDIKSRYGVNAVRPLADNTMRRVIRGVDKFVIRSGSPFLVTVNHSGEFRGQELEKPLRTITSKHGYGIASPVLIQYHTEQNENMRGQGVAEPLRTVDASNRYGLVEAKLLIAPTLTAIGQTGGGDRCRGVDSPTHTQVSKVEECLVAANLVEYYGSGRPLDITEPMHTITSHDREALTLTHICEFKGQDIGQDARKPLRTITASAGEFAEIRTEVRTYEPDTDMGHWPEIRALLNRFCGYDLEENEALTLDVGGTTYFIADIGLRMLTPRELYNAMGFPPDYIIDRDYTGRAYGKSKQVARCGNAVCPPMAEAVVRANLPEWCGKKLRTMEELGKAVSA